SGFLLIPNQCENCPPLLQRTMSGKGRRVDQKVAWTQVLLHCMEQHHKVESIMTHLCRFIAAFLVGAGLSLGQSTFGAILGRLSDPSGAPVSGAQVKAANRD